MNWFIPRQIRLAYPRDDSNTEMLLDAGLETWRNRTLDETPYLLLDAQYVPVRETGQVVESVVLVALGITASGHRTVLGVSVARPDAQEHWQTFFSSLMKRGLRGVRMISSDEHAGLKAAREAAFAGIPWQRCQSQLHLSAQALVLSPEQQVSVACTIRGIFNAPDAHQAEHLLRQALRVWHSDQPALACWAESSLPEGLSVFGLPAQHRVRLRTMKALESLHKEIKRRTRAAMPTDMRSCLRLVNAILVQQDEAWRSAKAYLNMRPGTA